MKCNILAHQITENVFENAVILIYCFRTIIKLIIGLCFVSLSDLPREV